MSEVFEGIICKSKKQIVEKQIPNLKTFVKIMDDYHIILPKNLANFREFLPDFESKAQNLSSIYDFALLFQYDSRVGYRCSKLFENGELKKIFTENEEIYVLLDDDGEPIIDGEKFENKDLIDDEEYETYKNAIELGMEKAEIIIDWKTLKENICYVW